MPLRMALERGHGALACSSPACLKIGARLRSPWICACQPATFIGVRLALHACGNQSFPLLVARGWNPGSYVWFAGLRATLNTCEVLARSMVLASHLDPCFQRLVRGALPGQRGSWPGGSSARIEIRYAVLAQLSCATRPISILIHVFWPWRHVLSAGGRRAWTPIRLTLQLSRKLVPLCAARPVSTAMAAGWRAFRPADRIAPIEAGPMVSAFRVAARLAPFGMSLGRTARRSGPASSLASVHCCSDVRAVCEACWATMMVKRMPAASRITSFHFHLLEQWLRRAEHDAPRVCSQRRQACQADG